MRKIILGVVAAAAIATPLVAATAASAQVNVDDNAHGIVSKGDVQQPFHYNAPRMQDAMEGDAFTFTVNATMSNTTRWGCSDGSIGSQTSIVTQERTVLTTLKRNVSNAATAWNLNGISTAGGKYIKGERLGAPYVGYCASGGFTGFLPNVFANDVVVPGTLKVTGTDYLNGETKTIALPNTI